MTDHSAWFAEYDAVEPAFKSKHKHSLSELRTLHFGAMTAKVGDTIPCPTCGGLFIKTDYRHYFCRPTTGPEKCKESYNERVHRSDSHGAMFR